MFSGRLPVVIGAVTAGLLDPPGLSRVVGFALRGGHRSRPRASCKLQIRGIGAIGAWARWGTRGLGAARSTAEPRGPAEGRGFGDPGRLRARHVRVRRAPGPDVCVCDYLLRGAQRCSPMAVWRGLGRAGALAGYYYYYLQRRKKKKPSRVSLSALHPCVVPSVHPSLSPARAAAGGDCDHRLWEIQGRR
jgi:hypothetical protein